MINGTDTPQKLTLNLAGGLPVEGRPTLWQMTGNSVDAANQVGKPQMVQAKKFQSLRRGNSYGCSDQCQHLSLAAENKVAR